MTEGPSQKSVTNPTRRTLIMVGATGIVAFVLGKIFGDHDSYLLPNMQGPVKETHFNNFIITESEDEMTLSDKGGEPIFIVDKASFQE